MELRNIARKKQKLSQNGIEKIFQQGFESRYCSAFVYVLSFITLSHTNNKENKMLLVGIEPRSKQMRRERLASLC